MSSLFDPVKIGNLELANRIIMAPMTRSRANDEGVQPAYAATYYAQRASAGLIITEATNISPMAKGYVRTPGIYTQEQSELDRFLNTVEAGVLYANRASGATTGAWPGFQTFCGWKGSGTTGKGGLGSWYVPQFMREQSHTLFGTL